MHIFRILLKNEKVKKKTLVAGFEPTQFVRENVLIYTMQGEKARLAPIRETKNVSQTDGQKNQWGWETMKHRSQ